MEVAALKQRVAALYDELANLEVQIADLAEENRRLRLTQMAQQEGGLEGIAFAALKQLYDDGFHVCNLRFGGMREEACLFCADLLQRASASEGRSAKAQRTDRGSLGSESTG